MAAPVVFNDATASSGLASFQRPSHGQREPVARGSDPGGAALPAGDLGGARFEEVGAQHGEVFSRLYHGRGLVMGDFDNDGDEDFLIIQNGGPPVLFRNDGGNRNAWVGFELVGRASGKDAVGAVVTVTAGGRRQVREKVGGASYLSAGDPRSWSGWELQKR